MPAPEVADYCAAHWPDFAPPLTILPDILTEAGYTIISRPMRGTSQYGVDAVALGPHPVTGAKALFLLSIKSGNLTRSTWNAGEQGLRQSLEDILEVYVPTHIAPQYQALPVVVALCFGGDIHESVRLRVTQFMESHRVPDRIDFTEWSGDHIADMMATGLLREKIFPPELQTSFRKAVALVDEPAVCIGHFRALLRQLASTAFRTIADRVRVCRQIHLATWTVFVWCRDAGNLDSAYQVSALAVLHQWDLSHEHFGASGDARGLAEAMQKSIVLDHVVSQAFLDQHVAPYSSVIDGLGYSVPSIAAVDVNLKLFEILGRVALHGLWLFHSTPTEWQSADQQTAHETAMTATHDLLCKVVNNNWVLNSPIRDDHAIEISLACLFLTHCGNISFVKDWVEQIATACMFSHCSGNHYPSISREYSDLALHPRSTAEYQEDATAGSLLYPTLAVWAALAGSKEAYSEIVAFKAKHMGYSTWQLWLPDEISDKHIYLDSATHGSSVSSLHMTQDPTVLINQVINEVNVCQEFGALSAVRRGQWPIVLMACRLHRLPIPPHFWFAFGAAADKGEQ